MELLDSAKDILEQATRIEFFHSVGQPIADLSVERIRDWRTALKMLASVRSRNFFLDASNAICDELVLADRREEFDRWNDIVDEADKVLVPVVQPRIELGLPVKGRRLPLLANEVVLQLRMAVVERQLRPWHTSDFFLGVFGWLQQGRLPCGGTADFPDGKLLVF